MKVAYTRQYQCACIIPEPGDSTEAVMDKCIEEEAVINYGSEEPEFVVQLRDNIGPETWTSSALLRSIK